MTDIDIPLYMTITVSGPRVRPPPDIGVFQIMSNLLALLANH